MSQLPLRILLVEDNPGDARLIQRMFADENPGAFDVQQVERLAEGLALLATDSFDLVLLDLSLPDSIGRQTFKRTREGAPRIPIVVLTGTNDEALALAAVGEGAQDYLVKDERLDGDRLARSVRYAIERHRLLAKLERLALLEERARIARDIHDGAIQSLFGTGVILKDVASMVEDQELATRIDAAAQELGKVIRDLRSFIFGLSPGTLTGREIDHTLRSMAESLAARARSRLTIDIDERTADGLGSHASDVLLMAREILSNVARHAEASSVIVRLRGEGESVVLQVEDDGRGFDLDAPTNSGRGLRNLQERASVMGGSVSVDARPGGGTTVRVRVPI